MKYARIPRPEAPAGALSAGIDWASAGRCSTKVQQPHRFQSATIDPHGSADMGQRPSTTSMPLDGRERVRAWVQICLPTDALAEADGNDDGNDGNQSRPRAHSGNHPRAGNASGPGQLSHLKSGRSFDNTVPPRTWPTYY